ncbi:MAG: DUF3472 domain-containing protein [Verrucomicrobia bacterium]|nr:DUF3472 domain-containing protein [Verrucomicrobiota bacterium]
MNADQKAALLIVILLQVHVCDTLAEPVDKLSKSIGQLGQEITWVDVPDSDGLVHAVQFSRDGRLFLTPNESFFPKRGLTAQGSGTVPDVANLNGGTSFAAIGKWDPGDSAEWGIWLAKPGDITLNLRMSGGSSSSRFTVSLGKQQSKSFTLSSDNNGKETGLAATVTFRITEPGRHSIVIMCDEGGRGAALNWVEISGGAAEGGGVLRKRWRPAAAHTKFTSSRSPDRVRLWVMEMDAVPGDLDFYCPITTPFGYYGPTWNADGTVNTGFNFSLWSFRRGENEPPIEQLSHLLAIGNRQAKFSGFDHEGTGVKIRDWEPLEDRQGQSQGLALRVEPGETYDTYYSYFYASDEKRWRLFGVGNKYNKGRPLKSLTVGSFVEVPGPPAVQRTGVWERRMRYRGWVMNDKGKWYSLDQMSGGDIDKKTGLTYTERGQSEDGWFYLQTGGWYFRKVRDGDGVKLRDRSDKSDVEYLNPEDIAFLSTVPSEVEVTKIERSGDQVRVSFTVRNVSEKAKVTIHWGDTEGLTFAERWQHGADIVEMVKEGENQIVLKKVPSAKAILVRALLQNDEGQFWSAKTIKAK